MQNIHTPQNEKLIQWKDNRLIVPDCPLSFYRRRRYRGRYWRAAKTVLNFAVLKAYDGKRSIGWKEVLAVKKG